MTSSNKNAGTLPLEDRLTPRRSQQASILTNLDLNEPELLHAPSSQKIDQAYERVGVPGHGAFCAVWLAKVKHSSSLLSQTETTACAGNDGIDDASIESFENNHQFDSHLSPTSSSSAAAKIISHDVPYVAIKHIHASKELEAQLKFCCRELPWIKSKIRKKMYKLLDEAPSQGIRSCVKLMKTKAEESLAVPLARDEPCIKGGCRVDDPVVELPQVDIVIGSSDPVFVANLIKSLSTTWASHRKSFCLCEMETLVGKLNHVAIGTPWLKSIMGQLFVSIASGLRVSEVHLVTSSAAFHEVARALHAAPPPGADTTTYVSFFAGNKARRIHHSTRLFHINRTLRAELQLVHDALLLPPTFHSSPIAHLVSRTPLAVVPGDSSLDAAGGYSSSLGFWWYLEWPPSVRLQKLRHVKNNKTNTLISINVLEYATILINYLAAYHSLTASPITNHPFPVVRIKSDNTTSTTSEAWLRKGCKDSMCGCALNRIHSSLILSTYVGMQIARISTADTHISSVPDLPDAFNSICQDHAALRGCRLFQPNAKLISVIMGALLEHALPHPARKYVVACYAGVFIQGKNNKGLWLRHATLMGYVCRVLQLHKDRQLLPPTSAPINYISIMTDAVQKWALLPNRRECIHDGMFLHILQTRASHHVDSFHSVATDWSLLGRYTGFRKSEWCQDSPRCFHCITDPLWGNRPDSIAVIAEDFTLKDNNGLRVPVTLSTKPSSVHFAKLHIRYQKNQDNYQVLTFSAAKGNSISCPVHAILRILQRGLRLGLPANHPAAIVANTSDPRGFSFITGSLFTLWLQAITCTVYHLKKGNPTIPKWGTHSIRVTATNLLHRAQFSSSFIKNRLRWRSNTFQMYLRNTFHMADKHSCALEFNMACPSLADCRLLEPQELMLAASAA
ncbi:hypothetical protein HJC23_010039 [Cyclotella cryptica]|uniref:Uncharacterized protein n=1 Tax=Cyclotella cryptica TaxID=29204 RepID=A0ABD3PRV2_9STRA